MGFQKISFDSKYVLKMAVVSVWFLTAIFVFHPHYRQIGEHYLGLLGFTPFMMYLACAGEFAMSIWLLARPWGKWESYGQIFAIIGFTIVLGILDPPLLVHPYGMLSKNIPLMGLIWVIFRLEKEGWNNKNLWLLRVSMAVIWLTEGLFPKILFQIPLEQAVVAKSGLVPMDPELFLKLLGGAQIFSGVLALVARGKLLLVVLFCQIAALLVLPPLVSWSDPLLWVHPFGPMIKNIPILIGTGMVFRRCLILR